MRAPISEVDPGELNPDLNGDGLTDFVSVSDSGQVLAVSAQGKRAWVLWEAAVGAAGEHGLGQVSRALRLDYRGLKDRMSSCRSDQAVSEPEPAFVRLEANPLFAEARWVVELEEPSGSRMR